MDALTLFRLFLALGVVTAVARGTGWAATRVRQPAVIGEMIAGILLGPSLFGALAPTAFGWLFPAELLPSLRTVAQIGVVLFLFVVGLELDPEQLRSRTRTALTIALAGIGVPLLLGAGVGAWLAPGLSPRGVPPFLFAAFLGVAMSVTAFPVLARIVAARGLERSPLGVMALTCAALDDACAWSLLAIVVSLATTGHGSGIATLGLTVVYVALMVVAVRPLLVRLSARADAHPGATAAPLAIVFAALLASAVVTEWIGIHALFGAFLLGALVPSSGRIARAITSKLSGIVRTTLLPVFFAFTGLRTQVQLVSGPHAWLVCAFIVAVAFLGKLGGVSVTARLLGMSHRRAASLGVLMNTRGLMELVVLNVGLDLGIISPPLFAMMVIMALVTTLAASPLLDFIGSEEPEESLDAATPARAATVD